VGDPHPNQLTSQPYTRPLTRTPRTRKVDPTAPEIIDETLGSHGGVTEHSSPLPPRRFVETIPDPGASGDGSTARGEALRGRDGEGDGAQVGVGVQADADANGDADDGDGGARFGTRYGGRVGFCEILTCAEGDAHARLDLDVNAPIARETGHAAGTSGGWRRDGLSGYPPLKYEGPQLAALQGVEATILRTCGRTSSRVSFAVS
jgi:hypothetical protein